MLALLREKTVSVRKGGRNSRVGKSVKVKYALERSRGKSVPTLRVADLGHVNGRAKRARRSFFWS